MKPPYVPEFQPRLFRRVIPVPHAGLSQNSLNQRHTDFQSFARAISPCSEKCYKRGIEVSRTWLSDYDSNRIPERALSSWNVIDPEHPYPGALLNVRRHTVTCLTNDGN
jgi:hypothetical protein